MHHPVTRVVNARQHNLRGISLDIPRRKLTVVTGPSGSGKSSLAFDTLYAEGQRRYIESLSTYAKQFLERMPKPLVDRLEGIAPAIAIEQQAPSMSSRSTVGTATEVHDFLRLLWARIGQQHCVVCGSPVKRDTPQSVADALAATGGRFQIAFPLPSTSRSSREAVVDNLRALGFMRIEVDGSIHHLDELPPGLEIDRDTEIAVVVDRLVADAGNLGRIAESVATAFQEGEGVVLAIGEGRRERFTDYSACSKCDTPAPAITPTLFSFNNPRGACPTCNGFGAVLRYDLSLIVPDPSRSIREGAIDPWTKPRYGSQRTMLLKLARELGADPDAPWSSLDPEVHDTLLRGRRGKFLGIIPFLERLEEKRYKQYIRVFLRQYQMAHRCPDCNGSRLRPEALAVRVDGQSIADAAARTVDELSAWLGDVQLDAADRLIADIVFEQLASRVEYLRDVGLGYLTIDRQTRTLSGGEAQRIALSNALGTRLVDALYVLDEPSIGLHPRDTDRLLGLLRRLRDIGNTLVVVEHDPAAIREADWMIELGPGAGEQGGRLVYDGPVAGATETLTGQYLSGRKRIGVPSARRPVDGARIRIRGARLHNLRDVDADIPLGTLTAVTGVSGSGKSTLVHDVLWRHLERRIHGEDSAKTHLGELVGEVRSIDGWQQIQAVSVIDQSPIGRTPRSNPVTYIKAFDEIRELFADQPLSRQRKYAPGTFSFNVEGGRCPACEGAGHVKVEMVFLADVYVPCEVCHGTRFKQSVLDVRIQGNSIADVLQWSVDEAIRRFRHQPRLGAALWQLQQVGLGYLRLGQPATTLSGGEAQRLKIARELLAAQRRSGRKLYLLDEPTTGLHQDDVRTLIGVLDRLVDAGHTVVVIEHHLDVIKRADWVIDMGPEAGVGGGHVVAEGTPEQVAEVSASHTGRFLRQTLEEADATAA
ncbi:MAG TPA: excinuclease ABC subunit UvrA [Gemmatimonadales bacterium]|nr:excinuclease ABC subunit UvrA [Gemmatimonadales bacterium]